VSAEVNSQSNSKGPPAASGGKPRRHIFENPLHELLFITFVLLFVVTSVFAWFSWDWLKSQNFHLEPLPIGLVVLVALLGMYVWKRTQAVSELQGLVRSLDQKNNLGDPQTDQFFQMILKSQQGFRDLIDSFDDILLALSLQGDIRAVNRSFAELVGEPFQSLIGRRGEWSNSWSAGPGPELLRFG
jgi:PAS domain-containing protein